MPRGGRRGHPGVQLGLLQRAAVAEALPGVHHGPAEGAGGGAADAPDEGLRQRRLRASVKAVPRVDLERRLLGGDVVPAVAVGLCELARGGRGVRRHQSGRRRVHPRARQDSSIPSRKRPGRPDQGVTTDDSWYSISSRFEVSVNVV